MKFTRDSMIWWLLLIVAVVTFLSSHFDLISTSFPAVSMVWESRLELVSAFAGVVAGYLRLSPLKLSPQSELAGKPANPNKALSIIGTP